MIVGLCRPREGSGPGTVGSSMEDFMGLASEIASRSGRSGKKAKPAGESIHYVVFREKDGTWSRVSKMFGTDSCSDIAAVLLAVEQHAQKEFESVIKTAYERLTGAPATPVKAKKTKKAKGTPAPADAPAPVESAPATS